MKQKSFFDLVGIALLGSFALFSVFLMLSGAYYGEWWGGFGLVLTMTSAICLVTFILGADVRVTVPQSESVSKMEKSHELERSWNRATHPQLSEKPKIA
jgi:uncharacterized membrane protein